MTGIIILAAGSSSRLGRPKQNLLYKGKTLLQRAIETAIASICEPVVVVLGANEEVIKPTIANFSIDIIDNADWAEGMASSIRAGLRQTLLLKPAIESIILMLCDQPFVDTYLINMLAAAQAKAGICASVYHDTIGPPVLFDAIYFEDLLKLNGSEGAKKVMQKYPGKVKEIPFGLGGIDIDTIADYERLMG
jgi:molybdenum cofactor cytidylyltransferase